MELINLRRKIAILTASVIALAGSVTTNASAATQRTYIIYDYNSGEHGREVENYSLTLQAQTQYSAYTVIPPRDDRVEYQNSGVVRLSSGGTGFVIGDHTIVTAAHCIYDNDTNSYVQNLSVTLHNEQENEDIVFNVDEAHIPYNFKMLPLGQYFEYDYAFVTVSESLEEYEHFKLSEVLNSAESNPTIPVNVCGFPDDRYVNEQPVLYNATGRFLEFETNYIKYDTDMESGESGGPVFINYTYRVGTNDPVHLKTVVAINTYEGNDFNQGTRITSSLLQFFCNNPYNTFEE